RQQDFAKKALIVKKVQEGCKKIRQCPHCSCWNGAVKKSNGIPLAFKHERFGNPKILKELPIDNFILADSVHDLAANAEGGNTVLADLLVARKVANKNLKAGTSAGRSKIVVKNVGEVAAGLVGGTTTDASEGGSFQVGGSSASNAGEQNVLDRTNEGNFNVLSANTQEDLTPLLLFNLCQNMSPMDCFLLNIERPCSLFLTSQPVPPGPIRPTVNAGNCTNDDDLTHQIGKIFYGDSIIRGDMKDGTSPTVHIYDLWRDVQTECARSVNSTVAGLPQETRFRMGENKKQIRSVASRLKGKEGRFRGNLMGKRVDYSGRTVISPDPNVEVDEIVIPEHVAKKITYPERVTDRNISELRKTIVNGVEKHPG
ncbi:unnamed protein product, partial [Amoebophrya sp. A25]